MEGDSASMMDQASKIWTMLDDMADSDPAAYRKFIDKQLKEGREYNKPPDPHMCVLVNILEPCQVRLYINFFSWNRIPKPKSDEDPINIIQSVLEIHKDSNGSYKVIGLAFSPSIISDYGVTGKGHEYTNCLVHLALDFVEEHVVKAKVARQYTLLPSKTTPYKGDDLKHLQQAFLKRFKDHDQKMDQEMADLQRNFGPLAAAAAMSGGGNPSDAKSSDTIGSGLIDGLRITADEAKDVDIKLPGSEPSKKKLIEEVRAGPVEPKYTMKTDGEDAAKRLLLRIALPDVVSVAECDLEVTSTHVKLTVTDRYVLDLPLPYKLDCDAAKAKFLRKSSVLKLDIPIFS